MERNKIDRIDKGIVKLLEKRFEIVKKVGKLKKKLGIKTFQPKREKEIIENAKNLSKNPRYIIPIFREMIKQSKRLQKKR